MDAAHTLQQLYSAGFELQTFERFPNAIGVVRGDVIALLENTAGGLRMLGSPGWRIGDFMGVLTSRNGEEVFQWKDQLVKATAERKAEVARFQQELLTFLAPRA